MAIVKEMTHNKYGPILEIGARDKCGGKGVRKQCGMAQNSQGNFLEQIVLREGHER